MIRQRFRNSGRAAIFCIACLLPALLAAQSEDDFDDRPRAFALPVELDVDRGGANGDAAIMRIQPLYTFPVGEKWKLVHLTMITLADAPSGTPVFPGDPGFDNNTGLSDLLHATFFTPVSDSNLIWGLGASISLPTATANGLGSDKWAGGPAVRITYRNGPWTIGGIATQRWSFAGSDNKPDVNQLLIRGAIRRQLNDDWYIVSAPLIVANWDSRDEQWLVPVGGGVGRLFTLGALPWAFSIQAYYNAIRADTAPDLVFRIGVVSAVQFGK